MKISVYLLIGLVLTVIESSILFFLPAELFKPDLGIPLIMYTTLFLDPQSGLITSLLMGFVQETFSNAPHGSLLFTKISIFMATILLKNELYIDSKYSFSYVCSGSVIFESFLFLILSLLARGETKDMANVMIYAIPNAIFTGFVSIFLFSLLERINAKLLRRE